MWFGGVGKGVMWVVFGRVEWFLWKVLGEGETFLVGSWFLE